MAYYSNTSPVIGYPTVALPPFQPVYNRYRSSMPEPDTSKPEWMPLSLLFFSIMAVCFLVLMFVMLTHSVTHNPAISVTSVSVSSFNLSDSHLAATFNVSLRLDNQYSDYNIVYNSLAVSVLYNGNHLAKTDLGSMYRTEEEKSMTVTARVDVSDNVSGVGEKMAADRAQGVVKFDIVVKSSGVVTDGDWRDDERYSTKAVCPEVPIGFTGSEGPGIMSGESRRCKCKLWSC